jgi:lipoyl(octanoyl) transferase
VRRLRYAYLGRVRYGPAWRLQEEIREAILAGRAGPSLLLLEHDPVVTLGRSARPEHLLFPREEIERRGIEVVDTSRGGSVTFHGPGQLVGYPVVPVQRGVREHVAAIGRALCEVLGALGIDARYRCDAPGIWVGPAKLASIGLHIRKGVAIHGFALNVDLDLAPFDLIVPCGLAVPMTSIARIRPAPGAAWLADSVAAALAGTLGYEPAELPAADLCASSC